MAIALVETTTSSINYSKYFKFEFDRYALCSDSSKRKILKRDVDIEIDEDAYDYLILVGSDAFKFFTKKTSITEYNGKIIDDKYYAEIKINFNKTKIINYFRKNKISYVEYFPKKILLIILEKFLTVYC